jgi:twitching motility protein PilT
VDIFDSERQEQVRAQLAITVQAVISQELLPCADGQGLVAVFEVMIATPGIRSLIRERKTHQIYTLMQGGGDVGMQTFDQHLRQLLAEGRIAPEEALAKARDPQEFVHRAQADLKKQEAE